MRRQPPIRVRYSSTWSQEFHVKATARTQRGAEIYANVLLLVVLAILLVPWIAGVVAIVRALT